MGFTLKPERNKKKKKGTAELNTAPAPPTKTRSTNFRSTVNEDRVYATGKAKDLPKDAGLPKNYFTKKKLEKQASDFAKGYDEAQARKKSSSSSNAVEEARAQARAGLAPATPQELGQEAPAIDIAVGPQSIGQRLKTAFTTPAIGDITPAHALGAAGVVAGLTITASAISSVLSKSQIAKVGTTGLLDYTITTTGGTAGTFATNAATTAITASWLTKVFQNAVAPTALVSATMGAIGSYPFAGFIKEEALQTIGFAITSAIKHDDQEGAREAIAFQKELLDPETWAEITGKVPFANVLHNLELFYQAARIKLAIDERIVENMGLGETEDQKYARIRQEQEDSDKSVIDYYNAERKLMIKYEQNARAAQRKEEAAFWAKEREKQRKLEAEDRKAVADFWFEYKVRLQKLYEDSRPSKLNFGLL